MKKSIKTLALLAIVATLAPLLSAKSKPNIVMIIVDDLGWRDVGAYGSELYETPHIDKLAEEGVTFSNSYASSPLCTPTRASIMTGQTVGRLQITTPIGHKQENILDAHERNHNSEGYPMTEPTTKNRIPLDQVTISKLLKEEGYATAFMGKWHLGYPPYTPDSYGFDVVIGGRGFPGPPPPGFFGPWDPKTTNMPIVQGSPNADDVIGDAAVDFIKANKDKAFFLALWFYNVHAPFDGKPDLVEKYRKLLGDQAYQQSAIMGAMVETVDQNVGKVKETLASLGLVDNTLIIFSSDNGGNMYDRPEGKNPTSNFPLRGGKGNSYEGGSRVPLIMKWPNKIAAGKISETVSISYDYFPTLLDVVGIETPAGTVLDGVSLVPSFDGSTMKRPPITTMFGHTVLATGNVANAWVRDGDWKLLRFFNNGRNQEDTYELYNLRVDPGETNNLVLWETEKAEELRTWLHNHLTESKTLLPQKNTKFNPDLRINGFKIHNGGYIVPAGPESKLVRITHHADHVNLDYQTPAGAAGKFLEMKISTNSAKSVTAATAGIYGAPVLLEIAHQNSPQTVRVPLGAHSSKGNISIIFDLEQPGKTFIHSAKLVD